MKASSRFVSIDALRGFDMFWIIGGDFLVHYLAAWTGWPLLNVMSAQLNHAAWTGFHAYDLVFPLFMFLSGVSLGIVLQRDGPLIDRKRMLWRVGKRAAILFLLGILYNWGWNIDPGQIRFASVLGLIGGAYLITAIVMMLSEKTAIRISAIIGILMIVTVLQNFVVVPGAGAGVLTPEGSINGWIDRLLLPGRLYGGAYDPEGWLGVFSGASITLAGALIGAHMMSAQHSGRGMRIAAIAAIGAVLVFLAIAISPVYPPIKKIWTATFDLMAIGASMILLAGAVLAFDRNNASRMAHFFVVIGANSILIYLAARYFVYPIYKIAAAQAWSPALGAGVIVGVIAIEWGILYVLYKKKVFLRI